ncbi:MAG: deoxycytidine triphosphate deaminase [Gammaproteobacteria bacterium]|nr:deoxycytidine triphosphate deaminase [Gammaproteobacteria bacterium]
MHLTPNCRRKTSGYSLGTRLKTPATKRIITVSDNTLTPNQQIELEAATFRRLVAHLDERKDVQNIDLMILAGFCRNCLSKWYKASADDQGVSLDLDDARQAVYGMTYDEWKNTYQTEATPEQLAAMQKANG